MYLNGTQKAELQQWLERSAARMNHLRLHDICRHATKAMGCRIHKNNIEEAGRKLGIRVDIPNDRIILPAAISRPAAVISAVSHQATYAAAQGREIHLKPDSANRLPDPAPVKIEDGPATRAALNAGPKCSGCTDPLTPADVAAGRKHCEACIREGSVGLAIAAGVGVAPTKERATPIRHTYMQTKALDGWLDQQWPRIEETRPGLAAIAKEVTAALAFQCNEHHISNVCSATGRIWPSKKPERAVDAKPQRKGEDALARRLLADLYRKLGESVPAELGAYLDETG